VVLNFCRSVYIAREQTFENWPTQISQKPKDLIQNGFFYTGVGDKVMCFYCNVTLKQWEKDRRDYDVEKIGFKTSAGKT
jgi:hypothetical protein